MGSVIVDTSTRIFKATDLEARASFLTTNLIRNSSTHHSKSLLLVISTIPDNMWGGNGGSPFTDNPTPTSPIKTIQVYYGGSAIMGIQLTYANNTPGTAHGTIKNQPSSLTFTLDDGK